MYELFNGKVIRVPPQLHVDARGMLSVYDFSAFAFAAVRSFIVEAPDRTSRGCHGHRLCRQVWTRLQGEIEIELRYAGEIERLVLDARMPSVLVEPPVWGQQTYHGHPAVLLVQCDRPYDPQDVLTEPV